MTIEIYSKDNCPWCEKAFKLFDSMGSKYTVYKLGVDYTKDELIEKIGPDVKATVPQIYISGTRVGGYTDLEKYILKNMGNNAT